MVAKTLGMLTGDFAFITLDFSVTETLRKSLESRPWSLAWNEMRELFEGMITLSVKKPGIRELQNLTKWLNTGLQKMPLFQNQSATSLVNKVVNSNGVVLSFIFFAFPPLFLPFSLVSL